MKRKTFKEVEISVKEKGYFLLEYYIKGKRKVGRIVIKSKEGYKYDLELGSFLSFDRTNTFVEKRNPYSLENISLWLKINNFEIELSSDNTYQNAYEKLKFYHTKCKEFFNAPWNNFYNNPKCSVCSGHQVGKRTSLDYLYPLVSKEWSPENEISPKTVTPYSHKRVYWICSKCGYGKNKEWLVSISDKTKGNGCPSCSGRIVSDKNRLSLINPILSSEWHPTKNGNLTPDNVSYGAPKKVWWICPKDHAYESRIHDRHTGSGCPKCFQSGGEQKIHNFLDSHKINNEVQYRKFYKCKNILSLPFDFYLPDYNLCIEYHGIQHYEPQEFFGGVKEFKKRKKNDRIKLKYCKNNNIPLLIISYLEFNNIEEILEKTLFN